MNFEYAMCLERKNEFTEHIIEILTPYIYEGLTCIYDNASKIAKKSQKSNKTLVIFQKYLQEISNWNQVKIDEETKRIIHLSGTIEYFDELVKAVIRANIIILTDAKNLSSVIAQSFYNTFSISSFIHRCYIECAKDAHNAPYLFYTEQSPLDIKRNQLIINQHIQSGITKAIRKILPISLILKEYMINSFIPIQNSNIELEENNSLPQYGLNKSLYEKSPSRNMSDISAQHKHNNKNSNKVADPQLEKQVNAFIQSEYQISDKQRIQTLLAMEKKFCSTKPSNLVDMSASKSSEHKQFRSGTKQSISATKQSRSTFLHQSDSLSNTKDNSENTMDRYLLDDNHSKKSDNKHLDHEEKKILNMNFEEELTESNRHKKSISPISLSSRIPGPPIDQKSPKHRTKYLPDPETSERIDPSKVDLIEDYGIIGENKRRR